MDRVRCPICLENAKEPLVCPSKNHALCTECFLRLPEMKCPSCRATGDFSAVPFITRICGQLPRSCECGAAVIQVKMNEHIENECPLQLTDCEWCSKPFRREQMSEHKLECLQNPVLLRRKPQRMHTSRLVCHMRIEIDVDADSD